MIVLSNKNINTNVCEFRADSAADILFLPTTTNYGTGELNTVAPCASGSVCIVTSTGDIFYLNGDENIWKLYGSSSGSGASMEEVLAITGDKTNLTTENKDNLVAAINEVAAGSQGGGYSETTLWTMSGSTKNPDNIILSESYLNFDVILFVCTLESNMTYTNQFYHPNSIAGNVFYPLYLSESHHITYYGYSSEKLVKVQDRTVGDYYLVAIIGIKF